MSRKVTIYLGPPGTGKTEKLIGDVERAVAGGLHPKRIAYLAFTTAAASEAKKRVVARFPNYGEADFPWFRTIHSAAFRLHNLSRDQVMNKKHWDELGEQLGLTFGVRADNTAWTVFESGSLGDRCLKVHALSLAREISLRGAWEDADEDNLAYSTVEHFRDELTEYKRRNGILDFTDMLNIPKNILDVDAIIVDEGQDLTLHQWAFVRAISKRAKAITIAGDDDQSIYHWAGADALAMLSFRAERLVLPLSHRLPRKIKTLASSVVERISARIPKDFKARDEEGEVSYIKDYDEAPLLEGRWLLLARHHYQLRDAIAACRQLGVVYLYNGKWSNTSEEVRAVIAYERVRRGDRLPYSEARAVASWIAGRDPLKRVPGLEGYGREELGLKAKGELPDWMEMLSRISPDEREYIRSMRRNGESLSGEGRIEIETIHGAKGWEADNVVLGLDYSRKVERQIMRRGEDDEIRVFYVGLTRAKRRLFLIQPRSTRAFWL